MVASKKLIQKNLIAASAGNHGLAVAFVCQQLSIKANICLPANASRLKRQRILDLGAGFDRIRSHH